MKKPIMYLFVLYFTLFCLNCIPVVVGGLIYKSTKTKHEKQEFLKNFHQTNLEREKAGLRPLDLCIAKYQFDKGWAMEDAQCKKKVASYLRGEIDEFGQKVSKTNNDKKDKQPQNERGGR